MEEGRVRQCQHCPLAQLPVSLLAQYFLRQRLRQFWYALGLSLSLSSVHPCANHTNISGFYTYFEKGWPISRMMIDCMIATCSIANRFQVFLLSLCSGKTGEHLSSTWRSKKKRKKEKRSRCAEPRTVCLSSTFVFVVLSCGNCVQLGGVVDEPDPKKKAVPKKK